jgi:hypothetical protein
MANDVVPLEGLMRTPFIACLIFAAACGGESEPNTRVGAPGEITLVRGAISGAVASTVDVAV